MLHTHHHQCFHLLSLNVPSVNIKLLISEIKEHRVSRHQMSTPSSSPKPVIAFEFFLVDDFQFWFQSGELWHIILCGWFGMNQSTNSNFHNHGWISASISNFKTPISHLFFFFFFPLFLCIYFIFIWLLIMCNRI